MTVRQLTPSSTLAPVVRPAPAGPHTASRALRQRIRQIRRNLSPFQQRHAARLLRQRISRRGLFQGVRHIAFYLPNDGEISTWPLLRHAWLLLPVPAALFLPAVAWYSMFAAAVALSAVVSPDGRSLADRAARTTVIQRGRGCALPG